MNYGFAVVHEMRLQFRQGFYFVYLFVSLAFIGILRALPAEFHTLMSGLFIYSDPGFLAMFFMGAIILFERQGNIQDAMQVTPCPLPVYLGAKILSLSLISVVSGVIIACAGWGFSLRILSLVTGLFLCSFMMGSLALILSVRTESTSATMLIALAGDLVSLPVVFPLLGWMTDPIGFNLLWLVPVRGAFVLIMDYFIPGQLHVNAIALVQGIIWAVILFMLALRVYGKAGGSWRRA